MIANFFRSLNARGVEYLLISGQATVLYGAATFSEDIDLWVNPTEANRERFIATLRDCSARYYKLTPALTVENLETGHGFHFILPGGTDGDVFLDVMGNPPRVTKKNLQSLGLGNQQDIVRELKFEPEFKLKNQLIWVDEASRKSYSSEGLAGFLLETLMAIAQKGRGF